MTAKIPKYRRQKRKNHPDAAFVELSGQRHYLGHFHSAVYNLTSQRLANSGILPSGFLIDLSKSGAMPCWTS